MPEPTEFPPHAPKGVEPRAQPAPRPAPPVWKRPGVVVAVTLAVMTIALTISVNLAWLRSGTTEGLPGPAPAAQTELMAEYFIGVRSILGPMLPSGQPGIDDLIEQTAETTPPPAGDLHAAALALWFDDADAAGPYLDAAGTAIAAALAAEPDPAFAPDPQSAETADGDRAAWQRFDNDHAALRAIVEQGADALDDDQRDRLIDRFGLLGEMALAADRDASDPARLAVEQRGRGTASTLLGFAVLVFGALGLGLILMIIGIVLVARGALRSTYDRWLVPTAAASPAADRVHPAYLESACVFLALFVLFKITLGLAPGLATISPLLQWGLLIAAAWPLVRGVAWRELRMVVGWHTGRGVASEVLAGIGGYLALLPVVAVAFAIVLGLLLLAGRLGLPAPSHPATEQPGGTSVVDLLVLYSLVAVWAPVVEETVFRGLLYHPLRRWAGVLGGAALSAVVFATIHPQGVIVVPALAALGFNFALLREWRGSTIAPMVAHALHNTVVFTFALLLFA